MKKNYLYLYLILTTIISLPAFTQPARHFGDNATSPTAREETAIPDTLHQQKEVSHGAKQPRHAKHKKKSGSVFKNQSHLRPCPFLKKSTNQTSVFSSAGKNGGDVCSMSACPTDISFKTHTKSNQSTHTFPIVNAKSIKGRRLNSPSSHKNIWHELDTWGNNYNQAKKDLYNATGITYSIDISLLGQRGAPHGHITPWQTQYYGTATWDMFKSDKWGNGSFDIAYELVRYWNGNAAQLGNNIGVINGVNDYLEKANYFYQLSYTQQFAEKLNWLSLTLGQFPLYNFDGTTYDSNQQITFINEALSQNASSTYATSGIGAYITIAPNAFWSVSAGTQNSTNIAGNRLSTSHISDWKYTTFISGTLNPKNNLGQATISALFYHQPSVPAQPGETNGWSLNAQQNLGKKTAVFGRINGASKGLNGIRQSYVIGGIYNNPLNRNALDQIGLAAAVNKLDKGVNGTGSRSLENVLEGYWAWGISSFMTITPDIQFYINPGLNQKSNTATVASVRATMMF